jgi:hypothetical protein
METQLPLFRLSAVVTTLSRDRSAVDQGRRGEAIAVHKRALVEWDRANPGVTYDPEWFRRDIWPGPAPVKPIDIAEGRLLQGVRVGRGKWTPHVSTWTALAGLVGIEGTSAA